MASNKKSLISDRVKKVKSHIKDMQKKGLNSSLATEGKSIEQIARTKKGYERFIKRKQVARERPIVEKAVKEIHSKWERQYDSYLQKRDTWRKQKAEERRKREERKQKEFFKAIDERNKKNDDFNREWKSGETEQTSFGMDENEEFELKEYLTNMLTSRMDGVPEELINKVKNAIYDAEVELLDRISDFFPQWDTFKEFYKYNDEDVYGNNTTEEKIEVLEELLRFIG